jgi:hypothetical protein
LQNNLKRKEFDMSDAKKIQFIVANYSTLQGLKSVPLGLLCVFSAFWGNQNVGRVTILPWLFVYIAITFAIMYGIEFWYKRTFGDIKRTSFDRRVDLWLMVGGGLLGLAMFLLEIKFPFKGSLLGVAFAAGFMADYVRALIAIGERNIWLFPIPPVTAILMVVISLLPFLGINWWSPLGLFSPLIGLLVPAGVLVVVSGILSHIYLLRSLSSKTEAHNGHAI